MADKKLSQLAAHTGAALAAGDLFVVVDVSDTTMAASGTDKSITWSELGVGYAAGLYIAPTGVAATDTAALQAAINYRSAAGTAPGSGVPAINIVLGPGTFNVNATIVVSQVAVKMVGAGVGNPSEYAPSPGLGTTIKWSGAAAIPMFEFKDCRNVYMADFCVQGYTVNVPSEGFYFNSAGGTLGTNEYMVFERILMGYLPWNTAGTAGASTAVANMAYCVRFGGTNANNDQFTFRNCQFMRPVTACFKLDNTTSIWGIIDSCMFEGAAADGGSGVKGFVTSSSCTLINPQFRNCAVDVEVNVAAEVLVTGWGSTGATVCGWVTTSDARLVVKGGRLLLSAASSGGYFMRHDACGDNGCIDLDGVNVVTGASSPRAKLRVRGNTDATPGYVGVRNCGLLTTDYDIVAGASGAGILVAVDDRNMSDRRVLTASQTYAVNATKQFAGTGSPVGVIVGSVGDRYWRTDGAAATTLYVKESGTLTNTGWVGK